MKYDQEISIPVSYPGHLGACSKAKRKWKRISSFMWDFPKNVAERRKSNPGLLYGFSYMKKLSKSDTQKVYQKVLEWEDYSESMRG